MKGFTPTWSYNEAGLFIEEIEHLFGFDLIVSQEGSDGRLHPITIIFRTEQMDYISQRAARRMVTARLNENWAQYTSCAQQLATAGELVLK
jgi:hypothetical protein